MFSCFHILLTKNRHGLKYVDHDELCHKWLWIKLSILLDLLLYLQSCGSLIESGLTVYEAYSKSQNSVDFIPIRFLLESHRDKLEQGIPLSKVFSQKRNPVFVQSLISAGESSGSLGISIIRAYDILDRDLDNFLKKFTTLVEPVMMIFMGLFVGTVATSIMVPIYNISSSLQR